MYDIWFNVYRWDIFSNFIVRIASNSDNKCKRIYMKLTCPNRFQAAHPSVRIGESHKDNPSKKIAEDPNLDRWPISYEQKCMSISRVGFKCFLGFPYVHSL